VKPGDRALEAGSSVHPGTIALLAALGTARVAVHRRPSVAILTTGDELRTPERYEDVQSGIGIPDSNGPMLAAAVAAAGGVPISLGIADDDPAALVRALSQGSDADVLVTVGGASMGEADLVKRVLEPRGFRLDFWRVKMRPGSPFGFGWLPRAQADQPVFSLPGNPASAFVTFELFVRPFLLATGGHRHVMRRPIRCVAGKEFSPQPGLTVYARVSVDSRVHPPVVAPSGPQGSGLVRSLAAVQGLAVVPGSGGPIAVGDAIDVLLLDAGPVSTGLLGRQGPPA
jgi:molybdopterin molybdotransferase